MSLKFHGSATVEYYTYHNLVCPSVRKCIFGLDMCGKQRLGSACTSTQSDQSAQLGQSLSCPHVENLDFLAVNRVPNKDSNQIVHADLGWAHL